ncbi:Multiprotein-bridging factor 1 [Zancudomyces culisetae]|uniref:Multiprotein-bridging factor 1 n=1 Tax=Zancudomyces culisetae TaxID=1213189 RepID=A0A1R1PTK1_ZANCU|nr:Multiprotein-bridging factor 1 [Zancudomyces culisetae]|eukprot:OMH84233.1 Multiprotein-bridging factor 1 [Zancudomyces culisetae]
MSSAGWDDVTVLKKHIAKPKVTKNESDLNAARRAGVEVISGRKTTSLNKSHHINPDHQKIAKLDREDIIAAPQKVELSVGRAIQSSRTEKGLSQKDLAVKINEKQNVINDYEAGRAIPNQQILGKLERALGIKLRGKDIGGPLRPPK